MITRAFEVRAVLAGAYRGRQMERATRLHLYETTNGKWGAPKTLCGRIEADRLCDVAEDPSELSCEACKARLASARRRGPCEVGPNHPRCGHSACRQNWIETGDESCVEGLPL